MRRLALAALLISSGAAAQSADDAVPDDTPPEPIAMRAALTGTTATLHARYAFDVAGPTHLQGAFQLELPTNALATAATITRDGVAHPLGLHPAEKASEAFGELGGEATTGALPSAVLIEGSAGSVTVSVASPKPGRIELVLEVSAPTCYANDKRYLRVPEGWAKIAAPRLRAKVRPGSPEAAALAARCEGTDDDHWLAFPSAPPSRRAGERLTVSAGRLDAGAEHVVRVELDLAATLSEIPRDLATVIVVDGSRSLTDDEREAQRALVASYLEKARDTRVQVVAYARTARPLLPGWMTAARAREIVDRELRALAPRNGSNFDDGLEEAGAWLAQLAGTRRVVLFTDERMAERLSTTPAADFKRTLPAGTLVHVVAASQHESSFERDDLAALAPLASATDGMSTRLGTVAGPDATMLLRPISLDRVTVKAAGWTNMTPDTTPTCGGADAEQIAEGDACTWWGIGEPSSGPIAIEGLVWGTRFVRVLQPDPARGRDLARELSARDATLDDELRGRVDELAAAVNERWALYAAWGGTNRYDVGGGIISGGCGCSGGSMTSIGTSSIGHRMFTHAPRQDLRAQLEPAIAHCKLDAAGASASVELEMTFLEIVDVRVSVGANSATANTLRRLETCVAEALWETAPMIARPQANETYAIKFGR